jgi:signal transduction histidine kinase
MLLDYILQRVTDVMDADRSTLYLVDSEKGELVSKIAQDMPKKGEIRLKIGQGIAGYTAETGKLVNIQDAGNDTRFDNTFDAITGYTTRNMLCSPMINNQGKIIGVIQVLNKIDGWFEREDEDILMAFSSQSAVAIENARLQEDLKKRMDELEMLHGMEIKIGHLFELDDILHTLLEDSMKTMEVESSSVILIDRKDGEFYFKAALGPKGMEIVRLRFPLSAGIAGWSAANRKALYVNDVFGDERFYAKISKDVNYPTRNVLCVPIFLKDEIAGVMEFINKTGRNTFFNNDDLKLAAIIASQAAKAIERANLFEKLMKTEKLSAIGSMASSIVHDLKTPISTIKGFTNLLTDEKISVETKGSFTEIINSEIDRFVRMTEELLEFAKDKKIKINIKECNIKQFIDYISPFIERDFEGRNIEFIKILDYDGTIKMNSEKMMRVILNLSGNAGDAMTKGGKFTIKAERKNDRVEFTISDTGTGIPEEIKDRLFEPFATSGKRKGTGLGLAIAKKIVEEHHGEIKVESKKGEGTTFYIAIPD